jgi:transposase-like protein
MVLIASVKQLAQVYPKTEIQRCIVHQIRNSLKFVSWDKKAVAKDLIAVYTAIS